MTDLSTYLPGKGYTDKDVNLADKVLQASFQEMIFREYLEETGVTVKATKLLGMRFSDKDWYAVFAADYVEGEPRSDGDENSEVIWMPVEEALKDPTVPGLTKTMIEKAIAGNGFELTPYETKTPGRHLFTL